MLLQTFVLVGALAMIAIYFAENKPRGVLLALDRPRAEPRSRD